jgi:altronate hydrolase
MNDQKAVIIRLNAQDNVAVALRRLEPNALISKEGLVCREEIPSGHKVALNEIIANEPVRNYGQIIGFATKTIRPGEWVQ